MTGRATVFVVGASIALILVSLVAGAVFGIWRGYDVTRYSPGTFLEVHRGAVEGLNVLLPAMGGAALLLILSLGTMRIGQPVFWVYLLVAVAVAAAALVTALGNQPINAAVLGWSETTLPDNWRDVRLTWWTWHQVRLAATLVAQIGLIVVLIMEARASMR